jgi:Na+-transporting NADH:ubiquinone oxidoreductase subunit A
MHSFAFSAGLIPDIPSPPDRAGIEDVVTEEAAIQAPAGPALQITALVEEGDTVPRGAVVACLRHAPDVCLVSPLPGRVARISLLPGRKLSEIVLFREDTDGIERHDTAMAQSVPGLRQLMQGAGIWPWLRRRPFGGMPAPGEVPAAIVVMAADTRPYAPDPRQALDGREEQFSRGVSALQRLTQGPVLVCQRDTADGLPFDSEMGRVRPVFCGPRHPQGSAGIRIHQLFPAGLDAPVWDIHAEDVAALGSLLETGELPMTRLVRIAGSGLREARTIRTHPGADLRQLTQRLVTAGPQTLMSGSVLDGHSAHWLAPGHRQITVLPQAPGRKPRHWFVAALSQTAGAAPAIPTAALSQAFGAALPALPFVRALGSGDDEAAMRLGILSLLEEDVALADYVLGETGQITAQLRGMLDRIQAEFAP